MTDVASPCVDVCRMNPETGFCDGCLRTIDEIAAWAACDDEEKRAVLARVESRRQGARVVIVGETFEAALALPPESIKHFATLVNDLNPLHHDDAYARASRFGSLIASGTQPTAHLMAMLAAHFSRDAQPLGLEFGIRLTRAVKAHDVLTMFWRVTEAKWKASLNGDLVKLEGGARNQLGETVMKATATIVVMPKEPRA
ncbi:dehydratase [Caballeronia pedi]|uniref:Dehydratase n=1 Tax=Caballeronia pedi TaxID=1777141 RepID=A0A158A357_9BURK|nr:dehydratase [Caballeronia pedi]